MSAASKPVAPPPRGRWFQPRRPGFRWEQEGLDHLRGLLPGTEPHRTWATFRFTGASGRINECDVLIAVPGGVYLLKPEGRPGRVVNHGDTWQFHGADRVRTLRKGINHRGIVQAAQIREHQGGPAILFRHRESGLRLDAYPDAYGGQLTPAVRLDPVRQLAEAVRYAHNRSLYHRALAARSVYVSAREDGSEPVLRIADRQTAARDFETTLHRSLGDTPLDAGLIADTAQVYLAPETDREFADPVDLDVFGLGSLSYLLLTGRPRRTGAVRCWSGCRATGACTPTRSPTPSRRRWTPSSSAPPPRTCGTGSPPSTSSWSCWPPRRPTPRPRSRPRARPPIR